MGRKYYHRTIYRGPSKSTSNLKSERDHNVIVVVIYGILIVLVLYLFSIPIPNKGIYKDREIKQQDTLIK